MLWLTLLSLPTIYTLSTLTSFLKNLSLARKTNLPYTIFPVYEANLAYILLFETSWFPYVLNNLLPESWADILRDGAFRGRWSIKDRLARRYGGVYLTVTPGGISCHVGDAAVVDSVVRDRRGFEKPVKHLESFQMYGANVLASEGPQWTYHHRYTAPAFNEKNNALVWRESLQQTIQMTQYWEEEYSTNTSSTFTLPSTRDSILKLTLNIICAAGFGVHLPYNLSPTATSTSPKDLFKDTPNPAQGYTFTFRSVMSYMNASFSLVVIANRLLPSFICRPLYPLLRKPLAAYRDLESYLQALVHEAENSADEEGEGKHNLLERLVRSRREGQDQEAGGNSTGKRNPGLTDAEVLGNVYIFSLAGHETTATTLRFALVLLALHGDVQEEMGAEIQNVLRNAEEGGNESGYESVFPRLILPLCVMLETLRLYPPVVSIPKLTTAAGATISYKGSTHHLPPNVRVNLNANALHYSPEYWGPDAAAFDPRRWDKRNKESFLSRSDGVEGLAGPGLESPDIHRPVRGAFIPFSDGMRACIGRKFAQVEFVAALVGLFRQYRVEVARIGGESEENARRRADMALRRSATGITLSIGKEVPLVFRRREGV
ncbi:cytochrome P450 [Aspergillus karnatakaensis]|uniref:cytochrome P450 n=1 Tax=Aspergillus karnatakaensis TaxID=1810916 RepID=UPI003CCCB3C8